MITFGSDFEVPLCLGGDCSKVSTGAVGVVCDIVQNLLLPLELVIHGLPTQPQQAVKHHPYQTVAQFMAFILSEPE